MYLFCVLHKTSWSYIVMRDEYSDYTDKTNLKICINERYVKFIIIYLYLKYPEAYWYNELWLFKYFSDHCEIYNYLYQISCNFYVYIFGFVANNRVTLYYVNIVLMLTKFQTTLHDTHNIYIRKNSYTCSDTFVSIYPSNRLTNKYLNK